MDRSKLYKDERSTGKKRPSYTIIVVALCIATPEYFEKAVTRTRRLAFNSPILGARRSCSRMDRAIE